MATTKEALAAAALAGRSRDLFLRAVVEGDFRKNEATLYNEYLKKNPAPFGDSVILFISLSRNQMVFVHGFEALADKSKHGIRRVLWSERLRLDRGTWNPLMLVNYAERVGLHLVGLKRFENFYRALTKE